MTLNVMSAPGKTAWQEDKSTKVFYKGNDFEHYIRAILLTKDSFDVLYKTNDFSENMEDYVKYNKLPDCKFRTKKTGIEFFIETNFRGKFHDQVLEWCKLFELKRYQEIDIITPLIIVAGVGGRPSSPARVFMMPVKHIKFVRLYPGFLQKYEVRPDRSVSEDHIRRILEIVPS